MCEVHFFECKFNTNFQFSEVLIFLNNYFKYVIIQYDSNCIVGTTKEKAWPTK